MRSLVRAIENIDDLDEARVLALIDHLEPMIEEWREGQDLRAAQAEINQKRSAFSIDFQVAQDKTREIASKLKVESKRGSPYLYGAIGGGIFGLLLVIFAHALIQFFGLLFLCGGGASAYVWLQAKQRVDALRKEQLAKEKEVADIDAEMKSLDLRNVTIEEEIAARSMGFPEITLTNLRFPLTIAEVDGHPLLIDQSGVHPERVLRAVDVSALQTGVASIADKVDALLDVPPMLSPASASSSLDPLDRLYGEENELNDLVTDFTESLGRLRDVTLTLPIVPRESELSKRLERGQVGAEADADALTVKDEAEEISRITHFAADVSRSREQSRAVFEDLGKTYERLNAGCQSYAQARSASINALHASWLDVLQKSTWCNRRFYCARTVMSPFYLEDLLGISLDEAYRLDWEDMVQRLQNDDAIRKRLEAKPDLESQLRDAHAAVWEFMEFNGLEGPAEPRPRYIEDQLRENTIAFKRLLQKVATGSSFPLLNSSSEAVLFFDPDTEEWSSELSPYTYRTHEVLRYGSMIKAYSDLMIPLWEHLWTEKADFRKSETFRTNEQLIRMSEKEAEKLIDIANQFRSDMRQVRENLNNLGAELKAKAKEIVHFKEGMEALGLLSDRARDSIDQRGEILSEIGNDTLTAPDRYEVILAAQPQAQMESRGAVQDPIDLVRSVDTLMTTTFRQSRRLQPV